MYSPPRSPTPTLEPIQTPPPSGSRVCIRRLQTARIHSWEEYRMLFLPCCPKSSQTTIPITSPDVLGQIETLAAHLLPPTQISVVLDDESLAESLTIPGSEPYRAYQRGKLKAKLELHKSVLQLARQGSGPAQTLAIQMLLDQALGEP